MKSRTSLSIIIALIFVAGCYVCSPFIKSIIIRGYVFFREIVAFITTDYYPDYYQEYELNNIIIRRKDKHKATFELISEGVVADCVNASFSEYDYGLNFSLFFKDNTVIIADEWSDNHSHVEHYHVKRVSNIGLKKHTHHFILAQEITCHMTEEETNSFWKELDSLKRIGCCYCLGRLGNPEEEDIKYNADNSTKVKMRVISNKGKVLYTNIP